MFTDEEAAALYDHMYPWSGPRADARFYDAYVMAADSVLDVGCGTGAMLHAARERGHRGRLTGLDPDRAALARARRRADVQWLEGVAADAPAGAGFTLATMTGNAFQCLVTDEAVSASLDAVRAALRPGGRFAFDTRHPQARAWEAWNPQHRYDVVDSGGRTLTVWHQVDSVGEGLVAFHETTAGPDGTVLRVAHDTLRFLGVEELADQLAAAGFEIETQYGDWQQGPVTADSTSVVTVARRPAS
ncbi:class I SAM-dependent methyltransferase [Streptomyces mesophilus]|uniref:class I SAM-dependent methyltransferase n=1 Tax=Streptomyces mesophilus TaxID=1775132 RepID=UPI0033168B4F